MKVWCQLACVHVQREACDIGANNTHKLPLAGLRNRIVMSSKSYPHTVASVTFNPVSWHGMHYQILLEKVGLPDIVLGHTKVFMRHAQLDAMEHYLNERIRCATIIQATVRGWHTRCRTAPLLTAAREQRTLAAHTLAAFVRRVDAFATTSMQLQQEDADRFADRKPTMLTQSQTLDSQQRRERLKRAEQQRQEIAALRESILGQTAREFTSESDRLQAALSAVCRCFVRVHVSMS